ncbi:MAG TPA: universal stress protein [Pirellulaceae bacterium]|nr:universal stress protein [Pirellulaceae bacterium]
MNLKTILVSTDFSPSSDAALAMATALARDSGAKLLIVHVEEIPLATGGAEYLYSVPEPATQELKKMLGEVVPKDPNVAYEHRLLAGDPAEAIVRTAEADGVDMIVIGTHGRTGLTRLLMGSVAEAIVRRAGCPVLTVKQPHKA